MGMTENEAKEYGENYLRDLTVAVCKVEEKHKNFVRMAIQALSEIQQYRAIGTVEKLLQLQHDYWYLNEMCKEYSAIGTIDEFKALKEKSVIITQSDIDTFKVYIEDCMDAVAFGNTDWNHSLALALKCMELHKA